MEERRGGKKREEDTDTDTDTETEEGRGEKKEEEEKKRKIEKEREIWKKIEEKENKRREEWEEKREKEKREREKTEEQERRRRRRNVVWKGVEGESQEERRRILGRYMEKALGRMVGIREVGEVRGEDGKMVVIVEIENERDREELLEMGRMIWRRWGVGVEEDLTLEERRIRWKISERARRERMKGREVDLRGRKLWVDGREWGWDEEREEVREIRGGR